MTSYNHPYTENSLQHVALLRTNFSEVPSEINWALLSPVTVGLTAFFNCHFCSSPVQIRADYISIKKCKLIYWKKSPQWQTKQQHFISIYFWTTTVLITTKEVLLFLRWQHGQFYLNADSKRTSDIVCSRQLSIFQHRLVEQSWPRVSRHSWMEVTNVNENCSIST